jgi:hypothetical protein
MEIRQMIYRLTLATVAAVFFGIAAQSASAAIDIERPNAQEMEHGIAPAQSGYGTSSTTQSPETSEPEATESISAPTEQGISTSPGVAPETEPVTEPVVPGHEAQADEQEEPASEEECAELDHQINVSLAMAAMFDALSSAFEGNAVGPLAEKANEWVENAAILTEDEYEGGCHGGGGETAE